MARDGLGAGQSRVVLLCLRVGFSQVVVYCSSTAVGAVVVDTLSAGCSCPAGTAGQLAFASEGVLHVDCVGLGSPTLLCADIQFSWPTVKDSLA